MAKRGRPFEPGNKMGRGRPKGSRNRRTLLGKDLLEEHGPAIIRKMILLGLKGDTATLRALLPYILTRSTSPPALTGDLRMTTTEDLAKTIDTVLDSIASGQLSVDHARVIIALVEARRKVIQTEEFEARLKALEQSPGDQPSTSEMRP